MISLRGEAVTSTTRWGLSVTVVYFWHWCFLPAYALLLKMSFRHLVMATVRETVMKIYGRTLSATNYSEKMSQICKIKSLNWRKEKSHWLFNQKNLSASPGTKFFSRLDFFCPCLRCLSSYLPVSCGQILLVNNKTTNPVLIVTNAVITEVTKERCHCV